MVNDAKWRVAVAKKTHLLNGNEEEWKMTKIIKQKLEGDWKGQVFFIMLYMFLIL